jgi:hypothetical protein
MDAECLVLYLQLCVGRRILLFMHERLGWEGYPVFAQIRRSEEEGYTAIPAERAGWLLLRARSWQGLAKLLIITRARLGSAARCARLPLAPCCAVRAPLPPTAASQGTLACFFSLTGSSAVVLLLTS